MSNELVIDVGNLAAFDGRLGLEGDLKSRAEQGVQPLIHEIFALPSETTDDGRVVELPDGGTKLPREKRVPEVRGETKWEKYMKDKGMNKKKRERLVFDEESGEYLPRYGGRSRRNKDKEWIVEDKGDVGFGEDPFAKRKTEKKLKVKDNLKKKEKNLKRWESVRGPKGNRKLFPLSGLEGVGKNGKRRKFVPKERLKDSISVLQKSTASAGKFDEKVKGEPKKAVRGKKRKFDPVAVSSLNKEKERAMKVADRMLRGLPG